MDRDSLLPEPEHSGGPNTPALFLALFLLVLAFFILLVTISTLEEVKSRSVMDSLTSTFTSIVPPTTDPTKFHSREGEVLNGRQFQDEIRDLFASGLPLSRTEIVHPGRLMRVLVKADRLFLRGQTEIHESQQPFLDRLVAVLSVRPPGLRYDMEFVVGTQLDDAGALPTDQTLEIARAGAFARAMSARGLPPDSLAVGLTDAEPGEISIWFYVRGVDETRLKFQFEDDQQ